MLNIVEMQKMTLHDKIVETWYIVILTEMPYFYETFQDVAL